MAFLSPANVAQGFLQGKQVKANQEAAEQEKEFRGLQMDQIRADMRRARKQARVQEELGQQEAERKRIEFAREAIGPGIAAALALPEDQQTDAGRAILKSMRDSEVIGNEQAAVANQAMLENPTEALQRVGQLFGIEQPEQDAPTGAFNLVQLPDGSRMQFRRDDPRLDQLVANGARVIDDEAFNDPLNERRRQPALESGQPSLPEQGGNQPERPQDGRLIPREDDPFLRADDSEVPIDVINEATGPLRALVRVGQRIPFVGDLMGESGVDPRKATSVMNALEAKLRSALRFNTGRMSNAEIAIVEGRLPTTGAFSTDTAVRADLEALVGLLEEDLKENTKTANNPDLTPKIREEAQSATLDIREILGNMQEVLLVNKMNNTRIDGKSVLEMEPTDIATVNPGELSEEQVGAVVASPAFRGVEINGKSVADMTDEEINALDPGDLTDEQVISLVLRNKVTGNGADR